jgi:hypothetical protein
MASLTDSNKGTKRARGNGVTAVASDSLTSESSARSPDIETAQVEIGRSPPDRAARESHNAIGAAAAGSTSQSPRGTTSAGPQAPLAAEQHAMPDRVITRYAKVGDHYHFFDGNVAFRDEGHRLSTALENREVVRDLIAIAQERGWTIEITGTKEFQRRAWQEAQVAGLTVRHYEPTDLERQQLARRLSRERVSSPDVASAGAGADALASAGAPLEAPRARDPASPAAAADRVYRGRLVDHGIERYQFDPRQDESYFVVLNTPDRGELVIWGKDLERALNQSLSKPREGDEVVARQLGARPVTVSRPVRDEQGQVVTQTQVKTHLNRWLVETDTFLRERETLAAVVRDVGIDAKKAVAQHPELAGTYSDLYAARLVALQQNYRHPADLERFVNRTREAIAQEIERGEPLTAPLVKARYQSPTASSPRVHDRQQDRTL